MPKPLENTVSRFRVQRHEALQPRLAALARDVSALAARHPQTPVTAGLRKTAEDLLFEARRFAWHLPRGRMAIAPDHAGLAIQLGQALAGLEAFELAHSHWSAEHQAFVCSVGGGAPMPVKRLRPRLMPDKMSVRTGESSAMRKELVRRILAQRSEYYNMGYADGAAGRPKQNLSPPPAADVS